MTLIYVRIAEIPAYDVSENVYKLSYQPNCTRLKISFSICLTEHLVIEI